MTRPLVLALVTLSAFSTSCSLFRHDKGASARIPKPTRTVTLPPEKPRQSEPVDLPPPELAPEEPEVAQLPPVEEPSKLPPYRSKRPRPVSRVKDSAPEPEPEPAEEAAAQ